MFKHILKNMKYGFSKCAIVQNQVSEFLRDARCQYIHIYIYIYIERERERDNQQLVYINTHVYLCIGHNVFFIVCPLYLDTVNMYHQQRLLAIMWDFLLISPLDRTLKKCTKTKGYFQNCYFYKKKERHLVFKDILTIQTDISHSI